MRGRQKIRLNVGGVLLVLVGLTCVAGGVGLLRPDGQEPPDVIAGPGVVRAVAAGLLAVGVVLAGSGAITLLKSRFARLAGVTALILFVSGGFLGNYLLFGAVRPLHTGTNVVLAGLILWCLSAGRQVRSSDER